MHTRNKNKATQTPWLFIPSHAIVVRFSCVSFLCRVESTHNLDDDRFCRHLKQFQQLYSAQRVTKKNIFQPRGTYVSNDIRWAAFIADFLCILAVSMGIGSISGICRHNDNFAKYFHTLLHEKYTDAPIQTDIVTILAFTPIHTNI